MSRMLGGIPHLSAYWWKDRDLRHTFHLPCSECAITLEDIASLRIGLPVDGPIVTRVVDIHDWSGIYDALLGKVSENFFGS